MGERVAKMETPGIHAGEDVHCLAGSWGALAITIDNSRPRHDSPLHRSLKGRGFTSESQRTGRGGQHFTGARRLLMNLSFLRDQP